ncbi:phosphoethanolamine transferase [Arcobacter vandammei]|uniref:phosphoethanolamine transferase n=1 Tax=Arcobacter vandammei TaxID=2782243 RepID=UPI0018E0519C|nr:phosphoethanolamine transferase [Arcobacter vandammei]
MIVNMNIPRGKKYSKRWIGFWSFFVFFTFIFVTNPTNFKTIEKNDINFEILGVNENNPNSNISQVKDELFNIKAGEKESVILNINFLKSSFVKLEIYAQEDYIDGDILFEIFKNDKLLEKDIVKTGDKSLIIKDYLTPNDKIKLVASINADNQTWAKLNIKKIAISDIFLLISSLFLWLLVLFLTFRKNQAAITLGIYTIFLLAIYAEYTTFNQIDIKSLLANSGILIAIALLLALIFNFSKNIKIASIIAIFTALIFFVLAFVPLMFISYKLAFNIPLEKEALYSIFQSNTSESMEFITSFVPIGSILFIIFSLIFLFYISWWHRNSKVRSFDFTTLFILIVSTSIIAISYIDNMKLPNFIQEHYNTYIKELETFKDIQNKKNFNENFEASKEKIGETYIFVIGESLNKRHMQLYGYPRQTTPNLQKLYENSEILKFNNVFSNHVLTMSTLSLALTEAYIGSSKKYFDSASIVDILKKANFETIWLTNQNLLGAWDNLVSIIASNTDETISINNSIGTTTRTQNYDGELIKYLDKFLETKSSKNRAIFIHLMGSHLAYCQRFPKEYRVYNDDLDDKTFGKNLASKKDIKNFVNCYDNSVLYNDFVVSSMIESIKKQEGVNALIYMPDHAEEVFKAYAHDPGKFTFNMTQIPLIIWFSQDYKDKYFEKYENILENKNRYFSNDRLYDTLIGITDIKTPLYKADFDLSSNKYFINEKEASTLHGKIKFAQNDNFIYWQGKNFDYLLENSINDKFIINSINSLGKLNDIIEFGFKSFGLKLSLNKDKKLVIKDNEALFFEDILNSINLENIDFIHIEASKESLKELDNISTKFDIKSKLILNSNEIIKIKTPFDSKNFIKDIRNQNISKFSNKLYSLEYKSNFD